MTYPTPDSAIRAAVQRSPLRSRALDPRHVPGDHAQAEEAVEVYSRIWAALGRLPAESRQIVIAYARGWSYRTIAAELGISYSTVRRRHYPAREALQRRLVELGIVAS